MLRTQRLLQGRRFGAAEIPEGKTRRPLRQDHLHHALLHIRGAVEVREAAAKLRHGLLRALRCVEVPSLRQPKDFPEPWGILQGRADRSIRPQDSSSQILLVPAEEHVVDPATNHLAELEVHEIDVRELNARKIRYLLALVDHLQEPVSLAIQHTRLVREVVVPEGHVRCSSTYRHQVVVERLDTGLEEHRSLANEAHDTWGGSGMNCELQRIHQTFCADMHVHLDLMCPSSCGPGFCQLLSFSYTEGQRLSGRSSGQHTSDVLRRQHLRIEWHSAQIE
mmetsp:Transcript_53280/g.127460  ORF Transcript_53280/g.127460 Transcript_53280/m.127460 type:complete len:279 (-) Transcript_53280:169-1005(-)